MTSLIIKDIESISEVANTFISQIGDHTLLAFYGTMGAGKTTFIKAICEQLGVEDTVNSPTFAIVNEYTDREERPVYHFDCYRINKLEEAIDLGCEEYLYSGNLCLIEWPEMIEPLLPPHTIRVHIQEQPDHTRVVSFGKQSL